MAYHINIEQCNACGSCIEVCMSNAILDLNDFYLIDPRWCTECGGCAAFCYEGAIGYKGLDLTTDHIPEPFEIPEFYGP